MSGEKSSLVAKLAEVMLEVGTLQKDAKNEFHRYRYLSDEKVTTRVREALARRGIAVVGCRSTVVRDTPVVVVSNTYTLSDGNETVEWQGVGGGTDKGDKAPMKASTAARKYALINGLMLASSDDPEADVETDRAAAVAETVAQIAACADRAALEAAKVEASKLPGKYNLGKRDIKKLQDAVKATAERLPSVS